MVVSPSIYLFFAIVVVKGSEIREIFVDQSENITVACAVNGETGQIMWVRTGREDRQIDRMTVKSDGSLFLQDLNKNDTGLYTCYVDGSENGTMKSRIRIKVRTTPPALANVTIQPSTILALILWKVTDNGGYPIICFTAQYKLANSDEEWKPISPNFISPNSRQIDVYKLEPNTTYAFKIWAINQLGPGEVTEVEAKTLKSYEEIELARHFLAGAEKFDTRIWVAAVGIVMGTLTILGFGTCYLLYLECRSPGPAEHGDEQEVIELVPNIILNPGFEDNTQHHTAHMRADENSNNETAIRLNNNTVVQPRNV